MADGTTAQPREQIWLPRSLAQDCPSLGTGVQVPFMSYPSASALKPLTRFIVIMKQRDEGTNTNTLELSRCSFLRGKKKGIRILFISLVSRAWVSGL